MKEAYWGYVLIFLGVFALVVMMIIRDYQTSNDQDYYIMKEVLKDAMIDSVDYAYWRKEHDLRIVEQKFVENYLRRFANSMGSTKNYKIQFYDLNENPPKASVKVTTSTGKYMVMNSDEEVNFGIITMMSGILDAKKDIDGVGSSVSVKEEKFPVSLIVLNGNGVANTVVKKGSNVTFSNVGGAGYYTNYNNDLVCEGLTGGYSFSGGKVTVKNVRSEVTCTMSYSGYKYIVTLAVNNGTGSSRTIVTNGSNAVFTGVGPGENYTVYNNNLTCSGTHGAVSFSGGTINVAQVKSNVDCTMSYSRPQYQVKLSVTYGSGSATKTSYRGDTITFTGVGGINSTSRVEQGLSCSGTYGSASLSGSTVTITNVKGVVNCTLVYSRPRYNVYIRVENGTTGDICDDDYYYWSCDVNRTSKSVWHGDSLTYETKSSYSYSSYRRYTYVYNATTCTGSHGNISYVALSNDGDFTKSARVTVQNITSDMTCTTTYDYAPTWELHVYCGNGCRYINNRYSSNTYVTLTQGSCVDIEAEGNWLRYTAHCRMNYGTCSVLNTGYNGATIRACPTRDNATLEITY